ncbi:hypothetical protein [Bradyrhizobium sp. CCBAU 53415]|uniref:hypothetical protein n=1 Tax=Bradyrhizobium sp. CCBAU 53415 TaxID=1325119 RepID=UPI002305B25A|nr:hypothetical protein [Bradyrhizobium sp. CCBAU 53415]
MDARLNPEGVDGRANREEATVVSPTGSPSQRDHRGRRRLSNARGRPLRLLEPQQKGADTGFFDSHSIALDAVAALWITEHDHAGGEGGFQEAACGLPVEVGRDARDVVTSRSAL